MSTKKIASISILVLLLASTVFGFYALSNEPQNPHQAMEGLGASVKIVIHQPNGTTNTIRLPHDPFTVSFLNMLVAYFSPGTSSGCITFTDTDTGGTSRTFYAKGNPGGVGNCSNGSRPFSGGGALGNVVQIGTGAGTASPTDTAFFTPYGTVAGVSSVVYNAATGNVTFSGTIAVAPSPIVMTEVGSYVSWLDVGGSDRNILILHDTFSGIGVSNGASVVVVYTIILSNTGFTTNFGAFMAGLVAWYTNGGTSTVTFPATKTTGGGAVNLCILSASTPNVLDSSSSSANDTFVNYGSGQAATQRSDFKLGAKVGTSISGFTPTILTNTEIDMTTSQSFASQTMVSETALFAQFFYSSTAQNCSSINTGFFMMWRQTYSTVTVPAAGAIGTVFKVTFA